MKKWYVNGEEFDNVLDAVDEIMDNGEFEDDFEDFLRDEYGDEVEICGTSFDAVEALRELDYSEYDNKFDTWKDGKRDDVEMELNRLEYGDTYDLYGCEVEIRDADAELFARARTAIENIKSKLSSVPSIYGGMDFAESELKAVSAFIDKMEERIKEEE